MSCPPRRKGRRRRPRRITSSLIAATAAAASALALVGPLHSSLPSAAVPCDAAATTAPLSPIERPDLSNSNNLRYRRQQRRPDRRRRRALQQQTHAITHNVCRASPTLEPGEILARGEFLCHGDLRFGIDAARGQFIVGFAPSLDSGINGTNATIGDDMNGTTAPLDSSSSFNHATPAIQAWAAIPTTLSTLFTHSAAQTSFAYLTLTSDGNLLGYSDAGTEIYDSNYDYYNRLTGKKADSILGFSSKCLTQSDVVMSSLVGGVGENSGEMCVTLTSPARAGMPYGMVTWGIVVDPANFVEMPPPQHIVMSTPAPVASLVTEPTPRPTKRPRPTSSTLSVINGVRTPSASPTRAPTDNNLFDDDTDSMSIESTSIIWGTVWLDSNRNGAIDLGEDTVNDFEVKLYECSNSARAGPDGLSGSNSELTATTDGEGMYFFQVPAGRTYRIKFDIQNNFQATNVPPNKNENASQNGSTGYGYSHGQHTSTNMLGWTDCMTSSMVNPIQWNAGLYLVDDVAYLESVHVDGDADLPVGGGSSEANKEMAQLPSLPVNEQPNPERPKKASIGGHIYLDVDENGDMNSNERTAAVGGYTVNDAVIVVTLTDCTTDEVLEVIDVAFPGTYSFGNLTEGLYKLGYEMQLKAAAGAKLPYSFVDAIVGAGGEGDPTRVYYETGCGKLGKGEVIDSGNVGLRSSLEITAYSAEGALGPQAMSAEMDANDENADKQTDLLRTAAVEPEDPSEQGSNSALVPALVGVFVTLSVVAVAAVLFVKHRNGSVGTIPFLGSKTERENVRSVGSSIEGDDASMVSATPSKEGQQTAIGSLVVEAEGKSVAALTNIEGGDDGGSDSDTSSDEESESPSYTGMEFSLKNHQQQQSPNIDHGSIGGGGSPYQSSFSPSSDNNSSSHVREVEREEGSEGYEVYDDGEDEEHGGDAADYGPVISNIIAKYSQKQGGGSSDEEKPSTTQGEHHAQGYNQEQAQNYPTQQDHSQNYTEHQDQHGNYIQGQTSSYPQDQQSQGYSQEHNMHGNHEYHAGAYQQYPGDEQQQLAIVPSGGDHENAQHYQYGNAADYNQAGYYSNSNNAATYDQTHQYQYNAHDYTEQQYDETSTSGSSVRSSDPPAASYRDIPAANAGWDGTGGGGHPHHDEEHHHHQYEASHQYVGHEDGGAYATTNYEGYEANQYADGDGGAYAATYDSNQYGMANDDNGAYEASYDNYDGQHPPIDSNSSSSSSDDDNQGLDDDNESESSEEASNSGWSSSSSTTGTDSIYNWSHGSTGSSKAHRAAARRAQSNPRDDRRVGSWRHQAAIPENSTLEYNAYMSNENHDGSRGYDGTTQAQAVGDDNKSVLSSGSDQSSDPPGASYKNLHHQFPPPPRRSPPPRRASPNNVVRVASPNVRATGTTASPNRLPGVGRTSPHTSRGAVRRVSPPNPSSSARRGRSVPPPPPPRGYPSPPPR